VNDAIRVLVDEHDAIGGVLDALARRISEESAGGRFDLAFHREAFEFFVEFADHWHHAKEEDVLFPAMEAAGVHRESGPIGCMLEEHDEARRLVASVRDAIARFGAGDARAVAEIHRDGTLYIALLRAHIRKENEILFVMAERALSPAALARLANGFEAADRENGGGAARARLGRVATALASAPVKPGVNS
jgi:hemerythrin-like domain-containing protein